MPWSIGPSTRMPRDRMRSRIAGRSVSDSTLSATRSRDDARRWALASSGDVATPARARSTGEDPGKDPGQDGDQRGAAGGAGRAAPAHVPVGPYEDRSVALEPVRV